jgi:hypothetical protein
MWRWPVAGPAGCACVLTAGSSPANKSRRQCCGCLDMSCHRDTQSCEHTLWMERMRQHRLQLMVLPNRLNLGYKAVFPAAGAAAGAAAGEGLPRSNFWIKVFGIDVLFALPQNNMYRFYWRQECTKRIKRLGISRSWGIVKCVLLVTWQKNGPRREM